MPVPPHTISQLIGIVSETVVPHDPADVVTWPVSAGMAAQGRLVALERLIADGVPRFGVVIAQLVVRQKLPLPDVFPEASEGVTTAKEGFPAALPCRTVVVVPRLVNADSGMFVKVLLDPLIVLFVSVCVCVSSTTVSVASGKVTVRVLVGVPVSLRYVVP